MTRRRALRIGAALAAALALVAALAVWLVANTRFDLTRSVGEDGVLTVETRLPAATCRKVLSADFPWVRFECDPLEDAGGERGTAGDGGAASEADAAPAEDAATEGGAPEAGAAPAPARPATP